MTRRTAIGLLTGPLIVRGEEDYPRAYDVPEAYEVYSYLLPQTWTWQHAKAKSLVIAAETISPKMCLEPDAESADKLQSAISDYLKLTQNTWELQAKFSIEKPYALVPKEKIRAFFKDGANGWREFYAAYPDSGGYITLSPVGFNESKTVAVVNVAHHCGGPCGSGEFSVLQKNPVVQKENGGWATLRWNGRACAWAS